MAAARAASASGGGARAALSRLGLAGRPRGRTWATPARRSQGCSSRRPRREAWAGFGPASRGRAGLEPRRPKRNQAPLGVPRLQEPPPYSRTTLRPTRASVPQTTPYLCSPRSFGHIPMGLHPHPAPSVPRPHSRTCAILPRPRPAPQICSLRP